jgi:hypothetical protein
VNLDKVKSTNLERRELKHVKINAKLDKVESINLEGRG